MSVHAQILIVDDDEVTRRLLREVLQKEGYSVELADSGEAALKLMYAQKFSIILSDIRMAECSGISVLLESKKCQPEPAVILMTGFGSLEGAIEAIQQGAFDYVSKPFKMNDLKLIVSRALKHWNSLQMRSSASSPLMQLDLRQKAIIGKSPRIVEVYKILARAALSSSTVLIVGESGTGKELIARAIHDNSIRKKERFIALNCGALSENLLESELFGHVKGSFTGALSDKKGLFEYAEAGTLFLDEVGDVSPALQVKLLRVLQEEEFRPVGSNQTKKSCTRVIAATHRDLESLVRQGKFREDLYYRLKVISIELPPLRERVEDLPDLVEYFLLKYSKKNQKMVSHISSDAMALLKMYSWPGNIRELEHAVESAVAMSNTSVLFSEDFPHEMSKASPDRQTQLNAQSSLEQLERQHILKVLEETRFNKSKASELLGIDRATLYRKALRYGIELRSRV